MAKSSAQRAREYRERKKAKALQLQIEEVSLPLPAGTAAALADLMSWHGFVDRREAIATMIHRLHESGRAASAQFLTVTRHKYEPSENVTRSLREIGRAIDDTG